MKFKSTTELFLSLLILATFACNKKDEKSSVGFQEVTAPFLSASDFISSNESFATQSELASDMSGWDDLWHYRASTSSSGTVSTDSCMTNFKITMKSQDTFYVGGSEDLTSCLQSQMSSSGGSVNKFTFKTYMEVQCVGIDLSSFNGQNMTNDVLHQIETACGTATHSTLLNSVIEMDLTINFGGGALRMSTKGYLAQSNATGGSCSATYSAPNWINSTCIKSNKSLLLHNDLDPSKNGTESITKITSNNLIESNVDNDPFFVSGSVDIYYKGWNGSVTYNGVNTAANWTLTKDSVTETGTLIPTPIISPVSVLNMDPIFKTPIIEAIQTLRSID